MAVKNYVLNHQVMMIVLAIAKVESHLGRPCRIGEIAEFVFGRNEVTPANIVTISKYIQNIRGGIRVSGDYPTREILKVKDDTTQTNKRMGPTVELNYRGFFDLFLDLANEYPCCDKPFEEKILTNLKQQYEPWKAFLNGYASNYPYKHQTQTMVSFIEDFNRALINYQTDLPKDSVFWDMAQFARKNSKSLKEGVRGLCQALGYD